jgi:hypothetical protein
MARGKGLTGSGHFRVVWVERCVGGAERGVGHSPYVGRDEQYGSAALSSWRRERLRGPTGPAAHTLH